MKDTALYVVKQYKWTPNYSHNSPEYCPCPLVPRKSACSVTVHCCGCLGPSVLRGPVELLDEAVPDELWQPGEGKDGLLYGRHPSSGKPNGERKTYFRVDIYCCRDTHLTSEARRQKAVRDPADICRVLVPTFYARACHWENPQLYTWPSSYHVLWWGKQ